jgi:hypothetical protein
VLHRIPSSSLSIAGPKWQWREWSLNCQIDQLG